MTAGVRVLRLNAEREAEQDCLGIIQIVGKLLQP
jgi:hypothetical protein